MTLENIKKELIEEAKDPNDFNILISENGYSITPKWFYEQKQIAKQEDKPIIEDVNAVAEVSAYTLDDTTSIAETLALALVEIESLKLEIATLKGE